MPPLWIRVLQFFTICLMWLFTLGVLVFVPWLVFVAARWNDAPHWSLTIAVVMMPVYLTVAATLTYVYVGLQRGAPKERHGGAPEHRAPLEEREA
jgi:membrane protein implicated in regulation of membrane protease activity